MMRGASPLRGVAVAVILAAGSVGAALVAGAVSAQPSYGGDGHSGWWAPGQGSTLPAEPRFNTPLGKALAC